MNEDSEKSDQDEPRGGKDCPAAQNTEQYYNVYYDTGFVLRDAITGNTFPPEYGDREYTFKVESINREIATLWAGEDSTVEVPVVELKGMDTEGKYEASYIVRGFDYSKMSDALIGEEITARKVVMPYEVLEYESGTKKMNFARKKDGTLIAAFFEYAMEERPGEDPFWPSPYVADFKAEQKVLDTCKTWEYDDVVNLNLKPIQVHDVLLAPPVEVTGPQGGTVLVKNDEIGTVDDYYIRVTRSLRAADEDPDGFMDVTIRKWRFGLLIVSRKMLEE